jgi:ABC-type methionine transport system ATPase subunit
VFQTFNLLATMSAFENVELPMTILGERSAAECKKRAMHLLDIVGLQDRYAHLPSELSGGEQQRVTIARALANEPELLLLDEPTGDLDTRNTVDIMDLILKVNQQQRTTCVMVTHNPDLECQRPPHMTSTHRIVCAAVVWNTVSPPRDVLCVQATRTAFCTSRMGNSRSRRSTESKSASTTSATCTTSPATRDRHPTTERPAVGGREGKTVMDLLVCVRGTCAVVTCHV